MHLRQILTHKFETALLLFAILLLLAFKFGLLKKEYDLLDPDSVAEYSIKLGEDVEGELTYSNNEINFTCHRTDAKKKIVCGALLKLTESPKKGIDFSSYDYLEIQAHTESPAVEDRLRIAFKNFHQNYSYLDEDLTHKVNAFLSQKLVSHAQIMPLGLLRVQQWWLNMFMIPLEDSLPDISNTVTIDILAMQRGPVGLYETRITKATIHGTYLSQSEVLGITIICALIVASLMFREARLNKSMAGTDSLTGLINRQGMQTWLKHLHPSRQKPIRMHLFFIDVDDFKKVNDTHGHKTGDDLLIFISSQIVACLKQSKLARKTWRFVRLSGDEFLIIATKIDNHQAHHIARSVVADICKSVKLKDATIKNKISMGVASELVESTDLQSLIEKADAAMYAAKNNGKSQYKFYDETLSSSSMIYKSVMDKLNDAVQQGDFDLLFLPIFDRQFNSVNHVEVVLNRGRSKLCNLSALKLATLIEESNHIHALDRWLINQTCIYINKNRKLLEASNLKFYVNVSTLVFTECDFYEYLTGLLEEYNIPSHWIGLEIAESALHSKQDASSTCLRKLNQLGVGIALDDFGTSNTILHQLVNYPVHKIKIRRPITHINQDDRDNKIADSLFCIAKNYGLDVTVTSIDSQEDYQFFHKKEFKYIQGSLLSPLLTGQELIAELRSQTSVLIN